MGGVARFAAAAAVTLAIASAHAAADISDTKRLLFVADRGANVIDVIDPRRKERVHRIETEQQVDALIVTPYAPLLIYANRDTKSLHVYNLSTRSWIKRIALPLAPRHVVLDTTGTKIGITDSEAGGFALVSAYTQEILFGLPDVPPTSDVLFDPNDIDVFYSVDERGSIGIIDMNQRRSVEVPLTDVGAADLSSPSRSLDGRYIYVANRSTGEVYNMNAYSKVIYHTFRVAAAPARPYTTPEGLFLYVMDEQSGRLVAYDQNRFEQFADVTLDSGVDLVTVGRFDRMNLFLSTRSSAYYLYDNVAKRVVRRGVLRGTPLDAKGAVDGRTAFVAFRDHAELAVIELETGAINYVPATVNGAGAMAVGLSNNVCH